MLMQHRPLMPRTQKRPPPPPPTRDHLPIPHPLISKYSRTPPSFSAGRIGCIHDLTPSCSIYLSLFGDYTLYPSCSSSFILPSCSIIRLRLSRWINSALYPPLLYKAHMPAIGNLSLAVALFVILPNQYTDGLFAVYFVDSIKQTERTLIH